MEIIIRDLSKSYGGRPVLSGLNMTFTSQSPCCLMSPSGSGKTTLFRILMGLETADSGSIHFTDDTGRSPGAPDFPSSFRRTGSARPSLPLKMCG